MADQQLFQRPTKQHAKKTRKPARPFEHTDGCKDDGMTVWDEYFIRLYQSILIPYLNSATQNKLINAHAEAVQMEAPEYLACLAADYTEAAMEKRDECVDEATT